MSTFMKRWFSHFPGGKGPGVGRALLPPCESGLDPALLPSEPGLEDIRNKTQHARVWEHVATQDQLQNIITSAAADEVYDVADVDLMLVGSDVEYLYELQNHKALPFEEHRNLHALLLVLYKRGSFSYAYTLERGDKAELLSLVKKNYLSALDLYRLGMMTTTAIYFKRDYNLHRLAFRRTVSLTSKLDIPSPDPTLVRAAIVLPTDGHQIAVLYATVPTEECRGSDQKSPLSVFMVSVANIINHHQTIKRSLIGESVNDPIEHLI